MSLMDRVKNHISDNRGKYGIATGAGLAYGASKLPEASPLINQAGFNLASNGQNMALDAADAIGYGKELLLKNGIKNRISQNDIDSGNEFYNSQVGKFINPNPIDMVNAAEHSSKLYNDVQEAKAQAQSTVQQAQAQGQNYIDQGVNFVKELNPFTESILVPVKSMLLEGYQPEIIVEAVHSNHPRFNKNFTKLPPKPTREQRIKAATIQANRDDLADTMSYHRGNGVKYGSKDKYADIGSSDYSPRSRMSAYRLANVHKNMSKLASQSPHAFIHNDDVEQIRTWPNPETKEELKSNGRDIETQNLGFKINKR